MVGGLVGVSLNVGGAPFRYYRYQHLSNYVEAFPNSGGIAIGDSVYSPSYFTPHELVHAYVYRAWGDGTSNGLLREGIAVALSCEPGVGLAAASYDWRDLLHLHADSDVGYSLAGHFVTHLLRQYGMTTFKRLYQAISDPTDSADFEIEFARFYPVSMNDAWQTAMTTGLGWEFRACLGDWACWSTGSLNIDEEVTQDCASGIHRTLTVGAGQGGVVLSKSGGDVQIWRSCWDDGGPYLVLRDAPNSDTLHWVVMSPGTYTLTLWDKANVQLKAYVPASLLGDSCALAGEVQLDGQLATQIVLPAVSESADGFVWPGQSAYPTTCSRTGFLCPMTPPCRNLCGVRRPSATAVIRRQPVYLCCQPSARAISLRRVVSCTFRISTRARTR
jgi:hypothetical protein